VGEIQVFVAYSKLLEDVVSYGVLLLVLPAQHAAAGVGGFRNAATGTTTGRVFVAMQQLLREKKSGALVCGEEVVRLRWRERTCGVSRDQCFGSAFGGRDEKAKQSQQSQRR